MWIRFLFLLVCTGACLAVETSGETRPGGPERTPLGAERSGNADGTIPEWAGGITEPPADYVPGAHYADPFSDDPVLFSITAGNLDTYADRLSEGQMALLRAYPDTWRMNVYPTRRSASYPKWVYEAVEANAATARVIMEGKGGVSGANVSSPFPVPESGVEVVWNHNLRWRGIRVKRSFGQAAVTRKGNYTVTLTLQEILFPYGVHPGNPIREKFPNILMAVKGKFIQPELIAGDGSLVIEPIDRTQNPRKSWSYNSALRRILRAPYIANAYPAIHTENLRTVDEFDMFNGSPANYDWKLLGKRELYIPYNAYRIQSDELGYDDIIQTHHIDPELARYELHRVWVVEGTLKPDMKHIYKRRVFYLDEDSWQVSVADNYDMDGNLWRTSEAHGLNYYNVPVHWSALEVYHDLGKQRYLVSGLDNTRNPYQFSEAGDPREFSPNALNYYIR